MARQLLTSIANRRSVFVRGLAIMALGVAMLGAGCGDRLGKLMGNDNPTSSTEVMVIRGVPPPSATTASATPSTNP